MGSFFFGADVLFVVLGASESFVFSEAGAFALATVGTPFETTGAFPGSGAFATVSVTE